MAEAVTNPSTAVANGVPVTTAAPMPVTLVGGVVATTITVGTTLVASGTASGILWNNAGVLASGPALTDSTGNLTAYSADAGATIGPLATLFRDSASPAASDIIGGINFDGRSSTGVQRTYGSIFGKIISPTNAAESSNLYFAPIVGGAQLLMGRFDPTSSGLVLGRASAGNAASLTFAQGNADATTRHYFGFDGGGNLNLVSTTAGILSTNYLNGDTGIGSGAAQATTAISRFLLVNGGAGPPTGVPTNAGAGKNVMYVDESNSQLYLYIGGAWKQPKTPAGAATVTWQ